MIRLTLLFSLTFAFTACGDKSKSTSNDKPGQAAAPDKTKAVAKPTPSTDTTAAKNIARPTLLAKGAPLPTLSVKAHDGTTISNKSLAGKPAVFYFYPKDFTPG